MNAQMKRGISELSLLWMISKQEAYGYELLKKMQEVLPDQQERTTYAIIKRLHANEQIALFAKETVAGPTRNYYRITKKGEAYLAKLLSDWHDIIHVIHLLGIE